jgi:glutamyl-tRNA synthetase
MLWEALGHEPPRWAHVPVLVNEQRKKLSKRRDQVALESYRDDGILAPAMVNYLMTLGWTPPRAEELGSEIFPWDELEAEFRLEDVIPSPAFFDVKKLVAFNKQYIKNMALDDFLAEVDGDLPADWDRTRFAAIAPHIMERLERLGDAAAVVDFLFLPSGEMPDIDEASWDKAAKPEWALGLLRDVTTTYADMGSDRWHADELKTVMEGAMEAYGIKLGKAQALPRVAVTGRSVGPPLFESLEVLGQDETLARLRRALTYGSTESAPD